MKAKEEYKCPLGHISKPEIIIFAGGVSTALMPSISIPHAELAICGVCGIVFAYEYEEQKEETKRLEEWKKSLESAWVCSRCKTTNEYSRGICIKCGKIRENE